MLNETIEQGWNNVHTNTQTAFHHLQRLSITRDKKTRYMTIKKLQKVCKMQGRGRGLNIRRLTLARKVRDTEKKLLLSSFLCIINEAAAAGNQ